MDIGQYDEAALKGRLAALYAIEASLISLAVISGSVQLTMSITTPSGGATYADIFSAVNAFDDTALSNALGVPVMSMAPKLSCPSGRVESIGADGVPFCTAGNLLDAGKSATCPAGKLELGQNCIPCPRGSYCVGGVAVRCKDGTWLNATGAANATDCRDCPNSGVRCITGDELMVRRGFYMASAHDTHAYSCASADACLGGAKFGVDSCAAGHFGILCGRCSKAYYRSQRQCLPCAALTANGDAAADAATATTIAIVAVCTLVPMLVRIYLQPPHCIVRLFAWLSRISLANRMSEALVTAAALVKIGISYCQSLSALYRIPEVRWPTEFMRFMEALDRAFNLELFSVLPVECITGSPLGFYLELLATLLVPIGVAILPMLVVALHRTLALRYGWWLEESTSGWVGLRKALSHPRMYKLLTWAFLLLYPTLARKPLAVFDCIAAPGKTAVLREDPVEPCYEGQWFGWASAAGLGVLLYAIGLPLAAFLLAWSYHDDAPNEPTRERVTLLIDSYRPGYWACESLTLVYKFILTGLINLIPDPRLQIWLGVVGNLTTWAGVIVCSPFQSALCNAAASTALLQLLLNYVSSFLFLGADSPTQVDLATGSVGSLLIALNCSCFAVLGLGSARSIWRARRAASVQRLRYTTDGSEVDPPNIQRDEYHLFLSHTWLQGDETMRTIKLRLVEMMPSAKIFLDKDNLKDGSGAEYIDVSKVVLVFCTTKYFRSRACARELLRAVLRKKPLIAVIEPDEARGGLNRENITALLTVARYSSFRDPKGTADRTWVARWALDQEIASWGYEEIPAGEQIIDALFASPPIEWDRFSAFQDISMRLIAKHILVAHDYHREVFVKAELLNQVLSPLLLTHGRNFHLYLSPHNIGAASVVSELQQLLADMHRRGLVAHLPSLRATLRNQTPSLKECTTFKDMPQCEQMLVYLNDTTWTNGSSSLAFARDVSEALRLGVRLLLVHEMPSAIDQESSRGACEFDEFWNEGWTPQHLLTGDANIYKSIAIALKSGLWRTAGLATVLHALVAHNGGERQPVIISDTGGRKLKRLGAVLNFTGAIRERRMSLTSAAAKMNAPGGASRRRSQALPPRRPSHLELDQGHPKRAEAGSVTSLWSKDVGREQPPSCHSSFLSSTSTSSESGGGSVEREPFSGVMVL